MPIVQRPDLDGSPELGGPSPCGGGTPGTGTGSSIGAGLPIGENGGVVANTWFLFDPTQNIASGLSYLGFYDTASFDDQLDGSSYSYRVEDIISHRVPTVNRLVLTYRDLGLATVTWTVTGTNDLLQVVSASVTVQLGNKIPTNALLTKFVDISLTAFRPQLSWSRQPNGGPLSLVAVEMRGEVEENQ
jgi:hypothetical protein